MRALAAATLALAVVAGCQARGGHKAARSALFLPPEQNQGQLLASVTVRGIDGTVSTLSQMAKDLGLPFKAEDLRAMLVARTGMPQALVEKLDLAAPMGVSFVAAGQGQSSWSAAAAQARTPDEAKAWVAALGSPVREERGATAVRTAEGFDYWVYREGALLVGSASFEGLRAAGAHAMASRQRATTKSGNGKKAGPTSKDEDLVIRIFPQAVATNDGRDLQGALAQLRSDALAEVKRARLPLPPDAVDPLLGALLDAVFEPLVDADVVDVALSVDAVTGLHVLSRLWPRPQTPLARNLETIKPYQLDPALRAMPLPAGLFAINYSSEVLARYGEALRALSRATTPGLKVMASGLQSLLAALTSAQSGTFGFAGGPEHTIIAPLRAGAQPGAAMAALENVLGPAGLGTVVEETHRRNVGQHAAGAAPRPPEIKWQRQGERARLDMTLPSPNTSRPEAALLGALSGNRLSYTVAVSEGRLLMTSSPRGEAHLGPLLAKPGTAKTDPELEQVLRETAGREGFIYADLFRLLRPALATAARQEPSLAQANAVLSFIPGVDKLRMPVIASYVGGDHLHAEILLPYRTLQNVSNVLRPLLGMGLGGVLGGAAGH